MDSLCDTPYVSQFIVVSLLLSSKLQRAVSDTQACHDSNHQSGTIQSMKATVYETTVKKYIIPYCVSISQKGLMASCFHRRKKMCVDVFRCMYLGGRDVDKMVAQTNAYLAARRLCGDSKWVLICYVRAICARIVLTLVLSGWGRVEEMCHQLNPCSIWWGKNGYIL